VVLLVLAFVFFLLVVVFFADFFSTMNIEKQEFALFLKIMQNYFFMEII